MKQRRNKTKKWQAVTNRLPSLLSRKKTTRPNKRRAIQFDINIALRLTLSVSLRNFRIAKQNRTKKHKQLAIPFRFRGYRQVTLTLHKVSRRQKVGSLYDSFQPQQLIYVTIVIIGLVGIGYFGWQINRPFEIKPVNAYGSPTPVAADKTAGLPRSSPTKLRISKIGLDVSIVSVGLNDDNTIEVPPLHKDVVGWYKLGQSPGEVGPAVIIGHVDTYKGPSVFWRLRELAPGNKISIKRKNGSTVRFKVDRISRFSKTKFPTKKVYGKLDYPGLRLITCSGTFLSQTGEYSDNTVVFASKIK